MLKYNARLKSPARQLRQNLTEGERALWTRLRGKQLAGVQFYRQKPLGDYVVDFYGPQAKLVIEIDGFQHLKAQHAAKDRKRDDYLDQLGLLVLRFDSRQVLQETEAVLAVSYRTIMAQMP